ncbi:hypothetical protein CC80DRAFT_582239, partial [Byssothecium circinans]
YLHRLPCLVRYLPYTLHPPRHPLPLKLSLILCLLLLPPLLIALLPLLTLLTLLALLTLYPFSLRYFLVAPYRHRPCLLATLALLHRPLILHPILPPIHR